MIQTLKRGGKLNIYVDARWLSTKPTGVANLILGSINAWSQIDEDINFILLTNRPVSQECLQLLNVECTILVRPLIFFNNKFIWGLLYLPLLLNQKLDNESDCFWATTGVFSPFIRSGLFVILTVHDLVYLDLPKSMSLKTWFEMKLLGNYSIRRANVVWAISEFTRNRIRQHFGDCIKRKIVVGAGLNCKKIFDLTPQELESLRSRYRINGNTLLFVGTSEPRKNLRFLLSLMPILSQWEIKLIVVGSQGWGARRELAEFDESWLVRNNVIKTGYLSDREILGLYKLCGFFISASKMEGLGLPQLEAMSLGCPVICARNSGMVEVVGDAGIMIDGWDKECWASIIIAAFADRADFINKGMERAKKITFNKVCHELSILCKRNINSS